MTSQEYIEMLMKDDTYILNAVDVGHILHVAPQSLRECAKQAPEAIGFPFCFVGTHLIVPKKPFFEWLGINMEE